MNGGPRNRRGLTVKQAKFVKHYAETNGNGTEAAKRAGYSAHRDPSDPDTDKTLAVVATENLSKPKVQQELARTMQRALSPDEVLSELTEVAQNRPVIKGSDKLKALELIGKWHKMFTDKVETSSPQAEAKRQMLQDLAEKYHLTEKQAQAIVSEVYGDSDPDIIQSDRVT